MSHQLWQTAIRYKITPNQLYFLDCCRERIKPTSIIDAEAEAAACKLKGFITEEGNISNLGSVILNEFETYLVKTKKKVTKEVLGEDFLDRVKEYREAFPDIRLPSGELARQSIKEVKDRLVWFFKNYPEYDWDLVLDAADYYNGVFKRKNYMYMVTSSYFIKKTNPQTKEVTSKLADYCQAILDNPKILNIP
jgi:hypothetical protein